ncbi:MAG: metal ABC transporter ATP-binding protein [Clostridia bacterium]|nr:metal ABC transporter ATP-binding protein [Clostridia bacterium]
MALIAMRDVTIAFEGIVAVDHVSFEVDPGDYLVILGENGSGKSTLMRAMLGLVKPRSGSIVYGDGLLQNQIGYLPQQTAAQRDFPASVEEVVLSGCVNRMGRRFFTNRADREKAERNMALLDITGLRKKSYRNLSGGQQQRALLARALCATDALLLLDEPVTGLDPAAAQEFYDVIRELNHSHGVAVVMVSHDLGGAIRDASKVLVMDRGMDFFGDVEDYRANFAERAVVGRG